MLIGEKYHRKDVVLLYAAIPSRFPRASPLVFPVFEAVVSVFDAVFSPSLTPTFYAILPVSHAFFPVSPILPRDSRYSPP